MALALLLGVAVISGIVILGTFLIVGAVVASLVASGVYALKQRFFRAEVADGYVFNPSSTTALTVREIEVTEILPKG